MTQTDAVRDGIIRLLLHSFLKVPIQRMAKPEEIAAAVGFSFAADESSFTTDSFHHQRRFRPGKPSVREFCRSRRQALITVPASLSHHV